MADGMETTSEAGECNPVTLADRKKKTLQIGRLSDGTRRSQCRLPFCTDSGFTNYNADGCKSSTVPNELLQIISFVVPEYSSQTKVIMFHCQY
jgi:hypothetical protein